MNFTDVLNIGRAGLFVNLKSSVSTSDHSLCDGNPWVIVAEDTCIFFISRRVGGNFSKIQIILGISRLQDHNTIFRIKTLFDRIQSFFGKALFDPNSSHNAETLWLDENLSLFTFFGTDFLRFGIVCTEKPFSIPSSIKYCLIHLIYFFFCSFGSHGVFHMTADFCEFFSIFYEHTCDKYGFCNRSFRWAGCLEGFSWFCGETVQIQTVIPVCASDQWKFVRSEMSCCIFERTMQMLIQRSCLFFLIIKVNHFI